ncbi:LamG-like jellyroll fold domain-containing protein [Carboxylicivirga marina]|uniref:LamG-like jellyroll fold domain-containing protein n=1 Tax=Carboxylicivirga marina TaxID=2800988 RepID=UPI00259A229A|nr:LamG-like jellyroll fold domain-containing protein [uncultured Carboxylicivirga sp.]
MQQFYRLLLSTLLLTSVLACEQHVKVGKPLIEYNFNNTLKNTGMAKAAIFGPQAVAYAFDKKDTCLDLSINASLRQALSVKLKDDFSFNDYKGFTVSCRVKKDPLDPEAYTILSHNHVDSMGWHGWKINAQANGAWEWQLSDGERTWNYKPTVKQAINDGNWHQICFSYNAQLEEAKLFFDGNNVAIISLFNNQLQLSNTPVIIGNDTPVKRSKDLFNGVIDDFTIWSRALSDAEVKSIHNQKSKICSQPYEIDEQLKVMTWNIWDGGTHDGRYIGIQKITQLIQQENPDVVFLQESNNTGIAIADALNYIIYQRSPEISVLSRFPLIRSHNIFQTESFGCIELAVTNDESVIACPIQLSAAPDLSTYLRSPEAKVDSILKWENQNRGKQARFILSELTHLIINSDEKPIIIGGDFNSGSHRDWSDKNAVRNNNLSVKYPASTRFEHKGFTDSYRQLHPDETKHFGYTLSPRFDSIMHNRTSFIHYKGKKLYPAECYVVNEHQNGFPSDHAAVVTVFNWKGN